MKKLKKGFYIVADWILTLIGLPAIFLIYLIQFIYGMIGWYDQDQT